MPHKGCGFTRSALQLTGTVGGDFVMASLLQIWELKKLEVLAVQECGNGSLVLRQ